MNEIRDKLLALIASVQAYNFGPDGKGGQGRELLTVTNHPKSIQFGYGYFNGDKVLFQSGFLADGTYVSEELPAVDAVGKLLGTQGES